MAGREYPIRLDEDMAHVLIDTINAFRRYALEASNVSPWDDYEADPTNDPKSTERGWRQLLDNGEEFLRELVGQGGEVTLT